MEIALIGYGKIAKSLLKEIKAHEIICKDILEREATKIPSQFKKYASLSNFLKSTRAQIIVEAAGKEAVLAYLPELLKTGKTIILSSSGPLADKEFFISCNKLASKHGSTCYCPGGILGIEAIKSLKRDGLKALSIVTERNPKNLNLPENLSGIIFNGNAEEFLKIRRINMNALASCISVSGLNHKSIRVIVRSKPKSNYHAYFINAKSKNLELNISFKTKTDSSFFASRLIVIQILQSLLKHDSHGSGKGHIHFGS